MKELYRVYEENIYGYELNSTISDINDLFDYLDYIVLQLQPEHKILVIRHNIEHRCDEAFYLYKGMMVNTVNEYEQFRDRELRKREIEDIQYGRTRR